MNVDGMAVRRTGLSERAEQVFEKVSSAFVVLLGCAWAFSIAYARATGDKVNIVTPASAAVVSGLSDANAPTAAYVTDAVNRKVVATVEADASGESGKLRAEIRGASERVAGFSVITPRPASDVHGGRLGLYYIGNWPRATRTRGGRVEYRPPSGFIEVTPSNENTRLSQHFEIKDFLTHDQGNVWPKYVVVSMKLVDKLCPDYRD